jgi:hypothetical protein
MKFKAAGFTKGGVTELLNLLERIYIKSSVMENTIVPYLAGLIQYVFESETL